MATPRQILADQIQADNKEYRVVNYPYTPANVQLEHPVVSVFRDGVDPGDTVMMLAHTVQVYAYGARLTGAEAEDDLDDVLDAVWLSVERLPGWKVTGAKRTLFNNDTVAGWMITVTAQSPNVYRQEILKERAE